jgi:hypothetical protein
MNMQDINATAAQIKQTEIEGFLSAYRSRNSDLLELVERVDMFLGRYYGSGQNEEKESIAAVPSGHAGNMQGCLDTHLRLLDRLREQVNRLSAIG